MSILVNGAEFIAAYYANRNYYRSSYQLHEMTPCNYIVNSMNQVFVQHEPSPLLQLMGIMTVLSGFTPHWGLDNCDLLELLETDYELADVLARTSKKIDD